MFTSVSWKSKRIELPFIPRVGETFDLERLAPKIITDELETLNNANISDQVGSTYVKEIVHCFFEEDNSKIIEMVSFIHLSFTDGVDDEGHFNKYYSIERQNHYRK